MKQSFARPVGAADVDPSPQRAPRAFAATTAQPAEIDPFEAELAALPPPPRKPKALKRLLWASGGVLVSAALSLAAERLISDLFATNAWLGYAGLLVLALFVLALVTLLVRELWALRRLARLDQLQSDAAAATRADDRHLAGAVMTRLLGIYADRPDLARSRAELSTNLPHLFDGAEVIALGERSLVAPLDLRARALTAAAARRVALVTAVSPRAVVDVAYVVFESVRLAGAIAALYGARPGLFGFFRLTGAVLSHLAVTGGLVLTDGIVEQLVGQGLAAKLSARLGEGVVNGLMTVRVGIAAMRVVRPLPYGTQAAPGVRDFLPDLVTVTREAAR